MNVKLPLRGIGKGNRAPLDMQDRVRQYHRRQDQVRRERLWLLRVAEHYVRTDLQKEMAYPYRSMDNMMQYMIRKADVDDTAYFPRSEADAFLVRLFCYACLNSLLQRLRDEHQTLVKRTNKSEADWARIRSMQNTLLHDAARALAKRWTKMAKAYFRLHYEADADPDKDEHHDSQGRYRNRPST